MSTIRNKRWLRARPDPVAVNRLMREGGVSELMARLLVNRGIRDVEAAFKFLNPKLSDLHDPFSMAGMRRAVDRIHQAVERREKILIYGDYDVDGTTSTVILKKALSLIGADVGYYIPERLKDGYGLREDAIDRAHAAGVQLIISVDTGIRAHQVVEHARSLGLDIIITDHHLPEGSLPAATAILNPQRPDCNYPNKHLAGCGVAFKLAQALLIEAGQERRVEGFVKMAAIGTIADIVPLVGENRVIARLGLEGLARPRNHGLRALMEVAGIAGRPVTCVDVGFRLAPRINAMGRMAGAGAVVELFDAPDGETARYLARQMDEQNTARQRIEAQILEEVLEQIERDSRHAASHVAVIAGQGWHRGVIGIVAAKVVEYLNRPAIVLSIEDGMGHGSGRSLPSFHLLDALTSCADLFERFGGHAQAAGLVLPAERIGELRDRLNDYAARVLTEEARQPVIETDGELPLKLATLETIEEIARLEPFGPGNRQPVFEVHGVQLGAPPRVMKGKHLKLRIVQGSRWVDCMWWGAAHRQNDLFEKDRVSLAFTLSANTYNDRTQPQLELRDLKY